MCCVYLPAAAAFMQAYVRSSFSQGFHLCCMYLNCLFQILDLLFRWSNTQHSKSSVAENKYIPTEKWSSVDVSPAILLMQCLYLLPECFCFLGWCKSQSPGSQPAGERAYVLYLKVMEWVARQSYNLRVDSVQWLLSKDLQPVSTSPVTTLYLPVSSKEIGKSFWKVLWYAFNVSVLVPMMSL